MAKQNWRDYVERLSPPWLRRWWGSHLVTGMYSAVADVMHVALLEAMRAPWLAEDTSPDDALPRVGFDSNMPRYEVETNAGYRARLLTRWDVWPAAGGEQSIEQQLEAAGFVGAVVKDRFDWPGRSPVGYASVFWVLIPYGSHSVKPPRKWGDGIKWGEFYWGVGDAASALQVQTVRNIVEKWRDAGIICHQVVFAGTSPIWGEFKWGDGSTWGGTPSVVVRMTPKDFS